MIPERYRKRMAEVAPQFSSSDSYRVLSVDADSLIYEVAAKTNSLETAKRYFVKQAMTLQLLADADLVRLHLTPKHCTKAGRFKVIAQKPYQGQRKGKKRPELVEPLRYAVGRKMLNLPHDFEIVFNDTFEADDTVIMDGVEYGDSCVIYSKDKDLLCTRNQMLDPETLLVVPGVPLTTIGQVSLKELSSSKKVIGRGPLFFWAQMLCGDTADNIKGLLKMNGKLCGAVNTVAALTPFNNTANEAAVARFVLEQYKEIDQNPIPEGWLLWLYPKKDYNFWSHLKALGLTGDDELGLWLKSKFKEPWFTKEE